MRKPEIDYILGKMLDSFKNVSDLNITVGKPFQVESSGQLCRRGAGPAHPEAHPFSDGDLRPEPDQPGSAADGDPPGPGVLRFLL